ncbi:MAG TPA: DUF2892 domain-containing protein [Chitinophagaceae bacterium]|nr:DUF2892 domain-containing protein [Chitinophagaceae bacterium]
MKPNMGNTDRLVRIVVAALIAVLYFTHQISGTTALILMILAVVFLLTAFVRFCPLYLPFGIRTNKKDGAES